MQTSKDSFFTPKGGAFQSKEGSCKPLKDSFLIPKGISFQSKDGLLEPLKDGLFYPLKSISS